MSRWPCLVTLALAACSTPVPPGPGVPCKGEDTATCESSSRMLICKGGEFQVYSDCKGAAGCRVDDQTASCDTSGNGAGDRCPPTSENKVRCDPDAGVRILRCVDGGLDVIFTCPGGTICGLTDAGLTCI